MSVPIRRLWQFLNLCGHLVEVNDDGEICIPLGVNIAVDAGLVVNPEANAQVEKAVVFGMNIGAK
jgi:CO/xanthine dehydrogenase Mo-binding subunit